MSRLSIVLCFLFIACSAWGQFPEGSLCADRELVDKILAENILPFWYPNVIDKKYGGYCLNLDVEGNQVEPQDKDILSQARTLWFFSKLYRSAFGKKEHIEAAKHGYSFISSKMWDKEHGGFYWKVDFIGSPPREPIKQTCGQAFALYALTEFAAAAEDSSAERLARETFSLLEKHAYDRQFGGYKEVFSPDWTLAPEGTLSYAETEPDVKLFGTHIHLIESLDSYYRHMRDSRAKERLHELILIESKTALRERFDVHTERFHEDWTPVENPLYEVSSYGHDLEAIWLTMQACNTLRIPDHLLLDHYKGVVDYALQYGYDKNNGGFYLEGRLGQPANNHRKIWWVQCEAMVCLLKMYELTEDKKYFDAFQKTLAWTNKNLIDWESGEWFYEMAEDGSIPQSKAGQWKTPYHSARAMLEISEMLEQMNR